MFKDFKIVNGQQVSMGNGSLTDVRGKGTVEIDFSSGKKLTLKNTLFVPDIKKNLISVELLDKAGFQITVASGKAILTKNGVFVGKGYACNGMYKMSVNEITSSAYLCCSIFLWHSRLGHISKKNLKRMTVMGMIKTQNKDFEKCEICAKSKITRKPFPSVSRKTELLE